MLEKLARLLRMITGCATVADVDHFFNKTRDQYVKVQKSAVKKYNHEEEVIREAEQRKKAAEKVQRLAEKRIAKLNEMLEE
ncbi:hypothetical protein [Vibrio cholerae]|uniref:hypothetical protein n=2 Tax=Vibrio cholerae TaxID=666 RepID=UPI00053CA2D4|nr:hypothetical protein [Vibrio cholerae]